MLSFEYYDKDEDNSLPEECLDEISQVMEKYGYSACDISMDTIVFTL